MCGAYAEKTATTSNEEGGSTGETFLQLQRIDITTKRAVQEAISAAPGGLT